MFFPQRGAGESNHRKKKRELEISLIIQILEDRLKSFGETLNGPPRIFEFGSGDGFQIPYLKTLGNVTANDICLAEDLKRMEGIKALESSIEKTPIPSESFDVIFSNHVIEHIHDLRAAFTEIKRIAKPSALFAFAVPTNVWLALSVPARIYNNVRSAIHFFLTQANRKEGVSNSSGPRSIQKKIRFMGLRGHGTQEDFIKCYRSFKVESWRQLFRGHGFSNIQVHPLLIYGPSEWPLVPTLRILQNPRWCSSVLFTMSDSKQRCASSCALAQESSI